MPNASKYIIDVANIRPGGNPIKGLYVGSSEKKYATLGNKCIYDKVLYELSINNITNVEPNAQTVTISSYTSKRTHGNGTVDTLYINPSTKQVTANTSTANTKDTTVVVNQALTLDGTTTGTGVTVTITQMPDYATEIFLTISPKSTIPASGGSIPSELTNFNYSVKANHKSGNNNVDVTSLASISANVTGVTAPSKGVTASTETTAGNITFTASYSGLTSQVIVPIKQNENKVESYAAPTYTLSPGNTTLPASGGSVTATVSNVQQVRTWSSTSTDTITPTSTTSWTAQTISCNSRGTVTGDTLTLGTTTATVTANGKSTSKSYTVYQQANQVTNDNYSPYSYYASCSIGDGLTAGGGSATVTASAGHYSYYLYTSGSYDSGGHHHPDTVTTAMVGNGNDRFSYSNGTITHSSMGTTATTDTVTIRATNAANTSATGDASKSIVNQVTNDNYSPYSYYASCSIGDGMTASDGSATVTASAGHYSYYLYTSGSYDGGGHHHSDGVTTAMVGNGNNRFSYNTSTMVITHSSMGTTATTDTVTIRATNSTNGSTADASKSIVNQVTNDNYSPYSYSASVSVGNGISASGGSATVTASAGHYSYYLYTSGSYDGGGHWHTDGVSTQMTENGNNRFTYDTNTLTLRHDSMGTDVTTDYVTIKATNTTSTSATASTRPGWSNAITDYNYSPYNYYASCSIGDGMTAKGGSATVSASAGHYSYYLYTSGSYDSGGHHQTDGVTTEMVGNGNNRFSYSNGTITHSNMTTNETTDTVTIRATNIASVNYSDASKSIVNRLESTDYNAYNDTWAASASIGNGISAGGGSATVSHSASHRHVYYYLYTSESTLGPYTSTVSDGSTIAITSNGNNRFSLNGNTLSHSSMGTNVTTDTVVIKVTNSSNASCTGSTSGSWSNAITDYDYNASNDTWAASCSIGDGLTAAGGSASVSASASHRHVYYYLYTSQSTSGPYTSTVSDSVTTAMVGNGNNRFSYSNGTITHSSMTDNETTDTVTIRATNAANNSATGDASKSIVNSLTKIYSSTISVTVPGTQNVDSGAGVTYLTFVNVYGEQDYTSSYTSGTIGPSGSKRVGLVDDNANWTVTSNNTGFTVSKEMLQYVVSYGVNSSSSPRSAIISLSVTSNGGYGDATVTITQSAGVTNKFTITNSNSTYGVYGSFGTITPSTQQISGDFAPNLNRTVNMASDTVTLTNYTGGLQPSKTSGTIKFECSGGGGSGSMSGSINSGYVNITGTLTVKNGSTITITIS